MSSKAPVGIFSQNVPVAVLNQIAEREAEAYYNKRGFTVYENNGHFSFYSPEEIERIEAFFKVPENANKRYQGTDSGVNILKGTYAYAKKNPNGSIMVLFDYAAVLSKKSKHRLSWCLQDLKTGLWGVRNDPASIEKAKQAYTISESQRKKAIQWAQQQQSGFVEKKSRDNSKRYFFGKSFHKKYSLVAIEGVPYALLKPIGKGSTARVKYAQNLITGEWVAVKIALFDPNGVKKAQGKSTSAIAAKPISEALLEKWKAAVKHEREMSERFYSDVSGESSNVKSGIRRVTTEDGGVYYKNYLILPLGEQSTLADHINAGTIVPEQAKQITQHLLQQLTVLQTKEIVHNDIKPANIILDSKGAPKLSDFGEAHLTTVTEFDAGMSPLWAAPERFQMRHKAFQKPVADMYSMGLVLAQMYGYEVPYKVHLGDNLVRQPRDDKRNITTLPVSPNVHITERERAKIKPLIDWMTQADPEKRCTPQQAQAKFDEIFSAPKAKVSSPPAEEPVAQTITPQYVSDQPNQSYTIWALMMPELSESAMQAVQLKSEPMHRALCSNEHSLHWQVEQKTENTMCLHDFRADLQIDTIESTIGLQLTVKTPPLDEAEQATIIAKAMIESWQQAGHPKFAVETAENLNGDNAHAFLLLQALAVEAEKQSLLPELKASITHLKVGNETYQPESDEFNQNFQSSQHHLKQK